MKKTTFYFILILSLFFVACKPSYPVAKKRYNRLTTLYPELVLTDTVTVKDTIITENEVIVPEYVETFLIAYDTIIETKKIFIRKDKDKFTITVKPDTITFRDTIPYSFSVPGKLVIKKENNYTLGLFFSIISFILGFFLGKAVFKD